MAALATELRDAPRIEERLGIVQRELAESIAATKQETDSRPLRADLQKALSSLADDLAAVRKFMLQTAQLGWLNHELMSRTRAACGRWRRPARSSSASSAKLEETMRQLSESLAGQLKELADRLDTIQGKVRTSSEESDASRRSRRDDGSCTLMAGLLLALVAGLGRRSPASGSSMRESYDNKLKAHEKRIAEIEAKERGVPRIRRSARTRSPGIGSPASGLP